MLPEGLTLRTGPPDVASYRRLRDAAGLVSRTQAQAEGAIAGSWAFLHVVEDATGTPVAMGRIVGDGGWLFVLADLAVQPRYQRHGVGHMILDGLLDRVRAEAPPGAYVAVFTADPDRRLWTGRGFVPSSPGVVGTVLT